MNIIVETFQDSSSTSVEQEIKSRKHLGIEIVEITKSNKKYSISPKDKSACRVVEFLPGFTKKSLMHRTETIDYGIVLEGQIDLVLDNETIHLKKDDCFIQNGTNHAWVNNSDSSCKIFFVLVKSE